MRICSVTALLRPLLLGVKENMGTKHPVQKVKWHWFDMSIHAKGCIRSEGDITMMGTELPQQLQDN